MGLLRRWRLRRLLRKRKRQHECLTCGRRLPALYGAAVCKGGRCALLRRKAKAALGLPH